MVCRVLFENRWFVLQEEVQEARKTVLGGRHPDTLVVMSNLALTYWSQGQMDDAVVLTEEVLEARKTSLGDRHPSTLTSIANLACMYRSLGRGEDANMLDKMSGSLS